MYCQYKIGATMQLLWTLQWRKILWVWRRERYSLWMDSVCFAMRKIILICIYIWLDKTWLHSNTASTWVQPRFLVRSVLLIFSFSFLCCASFFHVLIVLFVKKILPLGQKKTRHNYVLSVQDWCYNAATLNVTVTQNIVSMKEGFLDFQNI
jgi:hypothetical protein